MPASPSRITAFDILVRVERAHSFASELLHSASYAKLSATDHALATELVMGVLRWRSKLDAQIAKVSSMPVMKLDLEVLTALRLGSYQVGWLDRVPVRAAIHESVELVKHARKRSAVPFANAVLRKLAAREARAGESYNASILTATSAKDLSETAAHPAWIIDRWVSQYGLQVARQICLYNQTIPTSTIRLRDSHAPTLLQGEGVVLAPGEFLCSARQIFSGDVMQSGVLAANQIAIQDEASQLVAALVGRGKRILDCCAAPGGKTWSIADRNPTSEVVAVEIHRHRAALLEKRVAANNVQVISQDFLEFTDNESFDRVLCDVPCSGTGTICRNPEIKWGLSRQDLRDLPVRQLALLKAAMRHVTPGGKLVYSTCSLEREENESIVERALHNDSSFRVVPCLLELDRLRSEGELTLADATRAVHGVYLRTLPGVHRCDGFFAAILQRA